MHNYFAARIKEKALLALEESETLKNLKEHRKKFKVYKKILKEYKDNGYDRGGFRRIVRIKNTIVRSYYLYYTKNKHWLTAMHITTSHGAYPLLEMSLKDLKVMLALQRYNLPHEYRKIEKYKQYFAYDM